MSKVARPFVQCRRGSKRARQAANVDQRGFDSHNNYSSFLLKLSRDDISEYFEVFLAPLLGRRDIGLFGDVRAFEWPLCRTRYKSLFRRRRCCRLYHQRFCQSAVIDISIYNWRYMSSDKEYRESSSVRDRRARISNRERNLLLITTPVRRCSYQSLRRQSASVKIGCRPIRRP